MNHGIAMILIAGIFVSNAPFLYSMEAIERPLKEAQEEKSKQIAIGKKTLSIAAIAALLAIPAAYLIRLVHTYSKEYSFPVIAIAVRYGLPFQPLYLKTLTYAERHDNSPLKNALIALNTTVFGENWRQTRSSLINDFITMHQVAFNQKYGAELHRHIKHMLKLYAAAADLSMRKSIIKTYTRGTPSLKNQAKYMHELEQKLGL